MHVRTGVLFDNVNFDDMEVNIWGFSTYVSASLKAVTHKATSQQMSNNPMR